MIRPTRWRPKLHCSIDVLYHAGVLPTTKAVGLMRDIERNRQDLARRIERGEAVRVKHGGEEFDVWQGAKHA